MFENLNVDWTAIVTIILGILSTVFGTFWYKAKSRLGLIVKAAIETVDVAESFEEALKDNTITKEEVEMIKAEFVEAKEALKAVVAKESK
jgi:hypothetical protein